jgi:Reverse transcriptase (RNA-dependent DNA polymerase)
LLETHFPGSTPLGEANEDLSATIVESSPLADRIVTKEKLKWAVSSFKPYKCPGRDGIYPILLQEGLDVISPVLVKLFRASLASGYIPNAWREVKVSFIPKAGRATQLEARSYRPISLMSFILKTLEKLVDRYIKESVLVNNPLHKYQYAYQEGKSTEAQQFALAVSTEAALHSLVARAEKTIDDKEFALAVFLDIEGAFDNTKFEIIIQAAERQGVHSSLIRWMYNMLKTREVTACLFDETVTITTARGCPQGGCLSCLMWSLVVNSLLEELNEKGGVWAQGFADDLVIKVTGIDPSTVRDITQDALRTAERWCVSNGLSINPSKTKVIPFTRLRKNTNVSPLSLFGSSLKYESEVKYLGVILDSTLTWNAHLMSLVGKFQKSYWLCRRMVGSCWGLKPSMMDWLYR